MTDVYSVDNLGIKSATFSDRNSQQFYVNIAKIDKKPVKSRKIEDFRSKLLLTEELIIHLTTKYNRG